MSCHRGFIVASLNKTSLIPARSIFLMQLTCKVAVGSIPSKNYHPKYLDDVEKPWKDADFEITFLQRVAFISAPGRYSEQRYLLFFNDIA